MKETNVGLGEQVVSRDLEEVLVAYGLGSCIGVAVTDPISHVCGLLHAVLPHPPVSGEPGGYNFNKYVESGIEQLITSMRTNGANRARLVVRIVGGANMLPTLGGLPAFDIGTRNIEAARTTLSRLNIPISVEEVGGKSGRTVRVYVSNGRVTVRVTGEKEHEI